uniref:Uncharacterized protein n=1 Tax=Glossina austeni TaxID=7395 RepID=A0A1A9VTE9_GLOAU
MSSTPCEKYSLQAITNTRNGSAKSDKALAGLRVMLKACGPLKTLCPRDKTDCRHQYRSPGKCKKESNPYPSYSECDSFEQSPPNKIECKYLDKKALSEIWQKFRHRLTFVTHDLLEKQ